MESRVRGCRESPSVGGMPPNSSENLLGPRPPDSGSLVACTERVFGQHRQVPMSPWTGGGGLDGGVVESCPKWQTTAVFFNCRTCLLQATS